MVTLKRPWLAELEPVDSRSFPASSLLRERAEELASLLGPGPAGWAVELGATMAARVTSAIPELAVDVVGTEVGRGCEAVALGVLAALARDTEVTSATAPEVLAGPVELVARGIGVEHMLRSIHLAHAAAAEVLIDAVGRIVPQARRFDETRRINDFLFHIVDIMNTHMSMEFARAHEAWSTSSNAMRMEVVEDILRGADVPLGRAVRVLGYDLSRWHLAVIAWTGGPAPAEPKQLREAAAAALAAAGCASTAVLSLGAQRVWAWGSRTAQPPMPNEEPPPISPGVRLATGLPGFGVDGFRRSHDQASRAARVGVMSTARDTWFFPYGDVDIVAMLSADLPVAGEFVVRELGELAGPGESTAVLRHTLKCYLDRDRSLARTADCLHVARNTVAYRVRRAEQLRGTPAAERRLQLHAALALADMLGDGVLSVG
ncbi:putative transcriptional regulator, PucR family [Segniliparus rotundus DSM 44985]|uniref:Putative transcriptional regulator, PucR family n=1 Tax=Segniliparus rotundus (strain ATCC BAA-972 / CDC 1076 / CIP 108378 / DSM 44985 / JCM 13578) TaxID=640132 RepID=D6ZAX7_SEGRD|nr:helix-turn-helix domain-containing protein [Segniliparus rotundus]ADG98863.1 putative transcriptional regulator, PucR family [Segniliparus rotundus DSM 44985]